MRRARWSARRVARAAGRAGSGSRRCAGCLRWCDGVGQRAAAAGDPSRAAGLAFDASHAVVFEREPELGVVCRAADVGPLGGRRRFDEGDPRERHGEHQHARGQQPADAPQRAAGRAEHVGESHPGHEQIGSERLDVEGQPDEHRAPQQRRPAPARARSDRGVGGERHQQDQQRVDAVGARDRDEGREHRQRQRAGEPGDGAEAAREREVEHADGEHAGDRLGQQQAERREAEELCCGGLQPERQRRLVDRDQAARIEGDEQEVVTRAQHRAHAGRVEDVAVGVLRQAVEVEHRREREDQRERGVARRRARQRSSGAGAARLIRGWARPVCAARRVGGACAPVPGCDRNGAQRASRSRSRSALAVPASDRRAKPRLCRDISHDDAALGQLQALALGIGAREGHQCRVVARSNLASELAQPLGQTGRELAGARLHGVQAGGLQNADGGARAGERLAAHRHRVKAPRVGLGNGVQADVGVLQVAVAAARDGDALAQLGGHVEHAGAVGPAQPLLAGARVGVAAQSAQVDWHRAHALRAVEDERHVERRQLARRDQAARPADVRAGDERCLRRDRFGELAHRGFAHAHAVQLACRTERAEQPGVLLVAGEDLVVGAERQPAEHLRDAFAGDVVSATSAVSHPRTAAYAARSSAESSSLCSK